MSFKGVELPVEQEGVNDVVNFGGWKSSPAIKRKSSEGKTAESTTDNKPVDRKPKLKRTEPVRGVRFQVDLGADHTRVITRDAAEKLAIQREEGVRQESVQPLFSILHTERVDSRKHPKEGEPHRVIDKASFAWFCLGKDEVSKLSPLSMASPMLEFMMPLLMAEEAMPLVVINELTEYLVWLKEVEETTLNLFSWGSLATNVWAAKNTLWSMAKGGSASNEGKEKENPLVQMKLSWEYYLAKVAVKITDRIAELEVDQSCLIPGGLSSTLGPARTYILRVTRIDDKHFDLTIHSCDQHINPFSQLNVLGHQYIEPKIYFRNVKGIHFCNPSWMTAFLALQVVYPGLEQSKEQETTFHALFKEIMLCHDPITEQEPKEVTCFNVTKIKDPTEIAENFKANMSLAEMPQSILGFTNPYKELWTMLFSDSRVLENYDFRLITRCKIRVEFNALVAFYNTEREQMGIKYYVANYFFKAAEHLRLHIVSATESGCMTPEEAGKVEQQLSLMSLSCQASISRLERENISDYLPETIHLAKETLSYKIKMNALRPIKIAREEQGADAEHVEMTPEYREEHFRNFPRPYVSLLQARLNEERTEEEAAGKMTPSQAAAFDSSTLQFNAESYDEDIVVLREFIDALNKTTWGKFFLPGMWSTIQPAFTKAFEEKEIIGYEKIESDLNYCRDIVETAEEFQKEHLTLPKEEYPFSKENHRDTIDSLKQFCHELLMSKQSMMLGELSSVINEKLEGLVRNLSLDKDEALQVRGDIKELEALQAVNTNTFSDLTSWEAAAFDPAQLVFDPETYEQDMAVLQSFMWQLRQSVWGCFMLTGLGEKLEAVLEKAQKSSGEIDARRVGVDIQICKDFIEGAKDRYREHSRFDPYQYDFEEADVDADTVRQKTLIDTLNGLCIDIYLSGQKVKAEEMLRGFAQQLREHYDISVRGREQQDSTTDFGGVSGDKNESEEGGVQEEKEESEATTKMRQHIELLEKPNAGALLTLSQHIFSLDTYQADIEQLNNLWQLLRLNGLDAQLEEILECFIQKLTSVRESLGLQTDALEEFDDHLSQLQFEREAAHMRSLAFFKPTVVSSSILPWCYQYANKADSYLGHQFETYQFTAETIVDEISKLRKYCEYLKQTDNDFTLQEVVMNVFISLPGIFTKDVEHSKNRRKKFAEGILSFSYKEALPNCYSKLEFDQQIQLAKDICYIGKLMGDAAKRTVINLPDRPMMLYKAVWVVMYLRFVTHQAMTFEYFDMKIFRISEFSELLHQRKDDPFYRVREERFRHVKDQVKGFVDLIMQRFGDQYWLVEYTKQVRATKQHHLGRDQRDLLSGFHFLLSDYPEGGTQFSTNAFESANQVIQRLMDAVQDDKTPRLKEYIRPVSDDTHLGWVNGVSVDKGNDKGNTNYDYDPESGGSGRHYDYGDNQTTQEFIVDEPKKVSDLALEKFANANKTEVKDLKVGKSYFEEDRYSASDLIMAHDPSFGHLNFCALLGQKPELFDDPNIRASLEAVLISRRFLTGEEKRSSRSTRFFYDEKNRDFFARSLRENFALTTVNEQHLNLRLGLFIAHISHATQLLAAKLIVQTPGHSVPSSFKNDIKRIESMAALVIYGQGLNVFEADITGHAISYGQTVGVELSALLAMQNDKDSAESLEFSKEGLINYFEKHINHEVIRHNVMEDLPDFGAELKLWVGNARSNAPDYKDLKYDIVLHYFEYLELEIVREQVKLHVENERSFQSERAIARINQTLENFIADNLIDILVYGVLIKFSTIDKEDYDLRLLDFAGTMFEKALALFQVRAEANPHLLNHVLDSICEAAEYDVPKSEWEWDPNDSVYKCLEYTLDLKGGLIIELASKSPTTKSLPIVILKHEDYDLLYPDLDLSKLDIYPFDLGEGRKAFRFEYPEHVHNQIEVIAKEVRFYREVEVFDGKFAEMAQFHAEIDEGWYQQLPRAVLGKTVFASVGDRMTLHSYSEEGSPLFAIDINRSLMRGKSIDKIHDLQFDHQHSGLYAAKGRLEDYPTLKTLVSFENDEGILFWHNAKHKVVELEFIRYGLRFEKTGNTTYRCLNQRYKGYTLDLLANDERRKFLPNAIVLNSSSSLTDYMIIIPHFGNAKYQTVMPDTYQSKMLGKLPFAAQLKPLLLDPTSVTWEIDRKAAQVGHWAIYVSHLEGKLEVRNGDSLGAALDAFKYQVVQCQTYKRDFLMFTFELFQLIDLLPPQAFDPQSKEDKIALGQKLESLCNVSEYAVATPLANAFLLQLLLVIKPKMGQALAGNVDNYIVKFFPKYLSTVTEIDARLHLSRNQTLLCFRLFDKARKLGGATTMLGQNKNENLFNLHAAKFFEIPSKFHIEVQRESMPESEWARPVVVSSPLRDESGRLMDEEDTNDRDNANFANKRLFCGLFPKKKYKDPYQELHLTPAQGDDIYCYNFKTFYEILALGELDSDFYKLKVTLEIFFDTKVSPEKSEVLHFLYMIAEIRVRNKGDAAPVFPPFPGKMEIEGFNGRDFMQVFKQFLREIGRIPNGLTPDILDDSHKNTYREVKCDYSDHRAQYRRKEQAYRSERYDPCIEQRKKLRSVRDVFYAFVDAVNDVVADNLYTITHYFEVMCKERFEEHYALLTSGEIDVKFLKLKGHLDHFFAGKVSREKSPSLYFLYLVAETRLHSASVGEAMILPELPEIIDMSNPRFITELEIEIARKGNNPLLKNSESLSRSSSESELPKASPYKNEIAGLISMGELIDYGKRLKVSQSNIKSHAIQYGSTIGVGFMDMLTMSNNQDSPESLAFSKKVLINYLDTQQASLRHPRSSRDRKLTLDQENACTIAIYVRTTFALIEEIAILDCQKNFKAIYITLTEDDVDSKEFLRLTVLFEAVGPDLLERFPYTGFLHAIAQTRLNNKSEREIAFPAMPESLSDVANEELCEQIASIPSAKRFTLLAEVSESEVSKFIVEVREIVAVNGIATSANSFNFADVEREERKSSQKSSSPPSSGSGSGSESESDKDIFTSVDRRAARKINIKMKENQQGTKEAIPNMNIAELEAMLEKRRAERPEHRNYQLRIEKGWGELFESSDLKRYFTEQDISEDYLNVEVNLQRVKEHFEPAVVRAAFEFEAEVEKAKDDYSTNKLHKLTLSRFTNLKNDLTFKSKQFQRNSGKLKEQIMENLFLNKSGQTYQRLQRVVGYDQQLSWGELLLLYLQQDIETIKEKLPSNYEFDDLKRSLDEYLYAETMYKWSEHCLTTCANIQHEGNIDSEFAGEELHKMLSRQHCFDPGKNPQIMLLQFFLGFILRPYQLQITETTLNTPGRVEQAVTGSGKTSVLMVLLALMLADGSHLVSLKFLEPLLASSLKHLQAVVGDFFGHKVKEFRFNSQMPTEIYTGERNKRVKVSLFKEMYEDLLRVILSKGALVTDRKTSVLIQSKFLVALNKLSKLPENEPPANLEMEKEHLYYQAKIVKLLRDYEIAIYDEQDRMLVAREEVHLRIGEPVRVSRFIWKAPLDIYIELLKAEKLKIRDNLQAELTTEDRAEILYAAAGTFSTEVYEALTSHAEEADDVDLQAALEKFDATELAHYFTSYAHFETEFLGFSTIEKNYWQDTLMNVAKVVVKEVFRQSAVWEFDESDDEIIALVANHLVNNTKIDDVFGMDEAIREKAGALQEVFQKAKAEFEPVPFRKGLVAIIKSGIAKRCKAQKLNYPDELIQKDAEDAFERCEIIVRANDLKENLKIGLSEDPSAKEVNSELWNSQQGYKQILDRLSYLKQMMSLYVPLALSKYNRVHYIRSEDGVSTIPPECPDKPREGSEYEDKSEDISLRILDFLDKNVGVDVEHLKRLIKSWQKSAELKVRKGQVEYKDTEEAKLFKSYFSEQDLQTIQRQEQFDALRLMINKDVELLIRYLTQFVLPDVSYTTEKASNNAYTMVSMSSEAGGFSASQGDWRGLHWKIDKQKAVEFGAVGQMLIRALRRLGKNRELLRYKASNPSEILPIILSKLKEKGIPIQTVIDGPGALRGVEAEKLARQLFENQVEGSPIKHIAYFDVAGELHYYPRMAEGEQLNLTEKGFVYIAAQNRGADAKLSRNLKGLYIAGKLAYEAFLQNLGRWRDDRISAVFAVSETLEDIQTVDDLVCHGIEETAREMADLFYRNKKHEPQDIVHDAMVRASVDLVLSECDGGSLPAELIEQIDSATNAQALMELLMPLGIDVGKFQQAMQEYMLETGFNQDSLQSEKDALPVIRDALKKLLPNLLNNSKGIWKRMQNGSLAFYRLCDKKTLGESSLDPSLGKEIEAIDELQKILPFIKEKSIDTMALLQEVKAQLSGAERLLFTSMNMQDDALFLIVMGALQQQDSSASAIDITTLVPGFFEKLKNALRSYLAKREAEASEFNESELNESVEDEKDLSRNILITRRKFDYGNTETHGNYFEDHFEIYYDDIPPLEVLRRMKREYLSTIDELLAHESVKSGSTQKNYLLSARRTLVEGESFQYDMDSTVPGTEDLVVQLLPRGVKPIDTGQETEVQQEVAITVNVEIEVQQQVQTEGATEIPFYLAWRGHAPYSSYGHSQGYDRHDRFAVHQYCRNNPNFDGTLFFTENQLPLLRAGIDGDRGWAIDHKRSAHDKAQNRLAVVEIIIYGDCQVEEWKFPDRPLYKPTEPKLVPAIIAGDLYDSRAKSLYEHIGHHLPVKAVDTKDKYESYIPMLSVRYDTRSRRIIQVDPLKSSTGIGHSNYRSMEKCGTDGVWYKSHKSEYPSMEDVKQIFLKNKQILGNSIEIKILESLELDQIVDYIINRQIKFDDNYKQLRQILELLEVNARGVNDDDIRKLLLPRFETYQEAPDLSLLQNNFPVLYMIIRGLAQLRLEDGQINSSDYRSVESAEWLCLKSWLSELPKPIEMSTYVSNDVLRCLPKKAQVFPFSNVSDLISTVDREKTGEAVEEDSIRSDLGKTEGSARGGTINFGEWNTN